MGEDSDWDLSCSEETTTCGSWTVSCSNLAKLTHSSYSGTVKQPRIVSASGSKGSCIVAVDRVCVYISEKQEVLRIPLKNEVDDLALLDGGFVVIGDSDGTVMTAAIQSDGDHGLVLCVKSSQKLVQLTDGHSGPSFHRILFTCQPDQSTAQIVVLTTQGRLVTVSGIKIQDRDMDMSTATLSTASVSPRAIDVVSCGDDFCLLDGDNNISLWERMGDKLVMGASTTPEEGVVMTQILPTADSEAFFTLDLEGKLYLWDVLTLVPVYTWSLYTQCPTVVDIRVIHTPRNDGWFDVSDIKLVLWSNQTVQVVKLPSMDSCFDQKMDGSVRLTKSAFSQEDIFVTECKMDYDDYDSETFTSVKFMCYTETSPEQKLMKLIARKRLDEAQQLIKLYGLQYNLVPHIVQQKMYEALPTVAETREQLYSCRRQIDSCDQDESLVRHASHELSILEHRLAAFEKVFGSEGYSPNQWQRFQQADLFHMAFELLASDRPEKAFVLWRCFQVDCATALNEARIQKMLQLLPKSVPVNNILDWLCIDIIPFLVHEGRQAWVYIINWTLKFVASMEHGLDQWPSLAISFLETIIECLQRNIEHYLDDTVLLWDDKMFVDGECLLTPLIDLLGTLRKLDMLKTRFKCDFSLDIVKQETKESIVYRMLDKLASVEVLESTLKLQIRPYIEYCGLDADVIFAQYVKDLLERLVQGRAGGLGWECKIQSLIEVIHSPKEKITAVLNLVNNAPLPIANFVRDVVKNVTERISHPLISKLEQCWCMKEADNLMVAYRLDLMSITPTQALNVAKYFIYQDKPSSMEDARKILKAKKIEDEAYLVECQTHFYIQNEKMPELLSYLKSLSSELGKTCARFCMNLAEMVLIEDISSKFGQAMKKTIIKYCAAGILVSDHLRRALVNDELQLQEVERTLHKIKTAKALLEEFNIGIDHNTLSNKEYCLDVFTTKVEKMEERAVFRFANLLGICRDVAVQYLVEKAVATNEFDAVNILIRKFTSNQHPAAKDAKMKAAKLLLNSKKRILIAAAYTLASQECSTCMPSDIKTWMVLSREARMMKQLCNYSQIKPTGASVCISKDLREDKEDWLESFYQETLLPFQSDSIVEDAGRLLQAVRDEEEQDKRDDFNHSISLASQEIIPCLSAHGHDILAFQLLSLVLARQQKTVTGSMVPSDKLVNSWKRTASQIFSKMLRSVPLDHKQALGFALIHSSNDCVALLSAEGKSCGVNFQRLKRVCVVGVAIAEILQDEHLTEKLDLVRQKAKWGHRLAKLGISFKEAYEGSAMQSLYILECLTKHPQCTIGVLKEYFVDLKLEKLFFNDVCIKFFRNLLLPLQPSPSTLEKANNVLQHIHNDLQELSVIKELFAETSSYNYEVLQFLLELWQEREAGTDFKGIELLQMLKLYKRRSRPCQAEIEEELAAGGQAMDADSNVARLSCERLSFHSLMSDKPWKFIGPELHLDNLQFWLSVVTVIGMSKDDLLIKVASNIVKSYTESKQACGNVTGKHEVNAEFVNMLKDVNQVLSQVDRLETAVFWSHATADRLQRVEEKVTALHCSMNLAKKWLEKAEEPLEKKKAEKSNKILSIKLPPLSTQWSLMKCGLWSNQDLRPLVKQPKELVCQLYQLPLQNGTKDENCSGNEGRTDLEQAVHEACEEIAEVNGLDLMEIQTSLLDSWLSGPLSSDDADQTMTFGLCSPEMNSHEDNLKRILFLLKSSNGSYHLKQVSDVAKMHEGPVSLASRKMAVTCLLKAASDDEIEKLLKKCRQEIQQDLRILTQLTVLEQYNIRFTPEAFQQVDKQAFVQSLWPKLKCDGEVVPVIASMCLDHKLFDLEVWNSILLQMVKLNLKDSLISVIVRLCKVKNLEAIKSSQGFLQAKNFISSFST